MPEMKVEKPEVVPASKTGDSTITKTQDQNPIRDGDLVTKLAPGRLPARASRI